MKFMPPAEKTIILPEGGWGEQCYYIVEVAFFPTNPVHRAVFYTGFLNGGGHGDEGIPGGYNGFAFSEDQLSYQSVHYMKALQLIATTGSDGPKAKSRHCSNCNMLKCCPDCGEK